MFQDNTLGKCTKGAIALDGSFSAMARVLVLSDSLSDTTKEARETEEGDLQYAGSGMEVVMNECAHGDKERIVE